MTVSPINTMDRKRAAILGAAVADAASLGFHWLYDQERIRSLEPSAPEFRQPSKADYRNVAGYFAHENKQAGDFSQYGEQHQTMLRTLCENQGVYNKKKYESAFIACFGYGGSFSGYIDHPTRDTLNAITFAENDAITRANHLPFKGSDASKRILITKILGSAKQFSGERLKKGLEAAVRVTDDDDDLVEHALNMLKEWERTNDFHGADDLQLPALSKLPALVAAYTQKDELSAVINSAVRVTNNNDQAVEFGLACATIIETVIISGDIALAIHTAQKHSPDKVGAFIQQALSSLDKSTPEVTADWGMACNLSMGFPSAIHNMAKSSSFTEAIRQNIYAGGDSCGRAIFIGAVMGACYGIGTEKGIPEQWVSKLSNRSGFEKNIEKLLLF